MIRHTIHPALPVGALYSFDQIPGLLEKENVFLSEESTEEFLYTCLTACLPKSRALKVLSHMVSKGILVYKEDVEYDVEAILDDDYDVDENKTYYYVKWVGWPLAFCTWEPEDNFVSTEIIDSYKEQKANRKQILTTFDDDVSIPELLSRLRSCVNSYVTTPAVIVQSIRDVLKYKGTWKNEDTANETVDHERTFRPRPRLPGGKMGINCRRIRRRAMPGPRSKAYQALREKSQRALKEWEKEINAAVSPKEARIYVENNVDLEGPPADFRYITDYHPGKGVSINNEPVVGCSCTDCYADRKTTCCSAMAVGSVPYSTARRLRLGPGEPIYECNKLCQCGDDCPFRVVQRGRQVKLTIYRTHNRGWGIKSVHKIKKGTFVMEYVGEVITCEEAETRGRQYDEEAMTYLFDLDFVGDPLYSVDARYMGNISHFVNHSCNPNLSTHCVYVDCMDLYLPRLALFAIRDVNAGEELCFDYRMTGVIADAHKSLNASGIARTISPSKDSKECTPFLLSDSPSKVNPKDDDIFVSPAVAENDKPKEASEEPVEVNGSTFDNLSINSSLEQSSVTGSEVSATRGRMKCLCGSRNCRGYLY